MKGVSQVKSRKNEARSLFKKCFANNMFSFVPYEIWRDFILANADTKTIATVSQSCWGFKELVENLGENNMNLARKYRKEGQIALALKYLRKCADFGNSLALFHLGYAYYYGGWGLKKDESQAAPWFKKAAERGSAAGMTYYSHYLRFSMNGNVEESVVWANKAKASKDNFAVAVCCYFGLGGSAHDFDASFKALLEAVKSNDEFACFWLGMCYQYDVGTAQDYEKAYYYYRISGEEGLADSQYQLGCSILKKGLGKDEMHAWKMKSKKQKFNQAFLFE